MNALWDKKIVIIFIFYSMAREYELRYKVGKT